LGRNDAKKLATYRDQDKASLKPSLRHWKAFENGAPLALLKQAYAASSVSTANIECDE